MNYNLQMREVPNGCITIDAQSCRQKLGGDPVSGCNQTSLCWWVSPVTPTSHFVKEQLK